MRRVAIIENGPLLARDFISPYLETHALIDVFRPWLTRALPGPDYDAYILTGDLANVTDGLKDRHLRELEIVDRVRGRSRIFASCFSHQMIAEAEGGRVSRRSIRLVGWESIAIQGNHPGTGSGRGLCAPCLNVDEVTEPPPGASVLGSSPNCRYQVLAYGEGTLTCQAHPELVAGGSLLLLEILVLLLSRGSPGRLAEFRRSMLPGAVPQCDAFMRGVSEWLVSV